MKRRAMDINCDMGESYGSWVMGNDEALMSRITTANAACGFHASDPVTMLKTVRLAKQNGVQVGSHPGLPDLLGFGRRPMPLTPEEAYTYVLYQTGALQATLKANDMTLHHIKPHGAFYSILKTEHDLAEAVAQAISELCEVPMLYWPAAPTDAALPAAAKKRGIRVVGEIYPDLSYAADGALIIQREMHGAGLDFVAGQVRRFIKSSVVEAVDGSLIELEADSICVHGDGANAAEVADTIRSVLTKSGCKIAPVME